MKKINTKKLHNLMACRTRPVLPPPDKAQYEVEMVLRNRPTKTAKGMTLTDMRSQKRNHFARGGLSNDALVLAVRGTTDKLASGLLYKAERIPCPHCGAKQAGKLKLNDKGRARLMRLRTKGLTLRIIMTARLTYSLAFRVSRLALDQKTPHPEMDRARQHIYGLWLQATITMKEDRDARRT